MNTDYSLLIIIGYIKYIIHAGTTKASRITTGYDGFMLRQMAAILFPD